MTFLVKLVFALAVLWVSEQGGSSVDARTLTTTTTHSIRDFGVFVPEKVTRCRMNCLVEFIHKDDDKVIVNDPCTDRPDCFMCWDFCKLLNQEATMFSAILCHDPKVCYDGCKFACSQYNFYKYESTADDANSI